MYLINKKIFFLFIFQFLFINNFKAQVQIGASYGYSFDFGKYVTTDYKSNGIFDLNLKLNNKTLFQPSISLMVTKIALNFSSQIIKNQGDFKTIALNNSLSLKLGIETSLNKKENSNIIAKFGFGTSFFSNPLVWIENSNTSYGYNTDYNYNKTEKSFAFIDLSIIANRKIFDNWLISLDFGSQYYPSKSDVSIHTKINGENIEINSYFSKFRPNGKIGLSYFL